MRRCVFLDRDGVINVKPKRGEYILSWEQFRLIPAAADWIRIFKALGYLVIVVTNQRCVALGQLALEELNLLHANMLGGLAALGAHIDDVYFCPHAEGDCDCRKPKTGMVTAAAAKWDIDLTQSLMIGDSFLDEEMARRCGLRFVAVAEGRVVDSVQE